MTNANSSPASGDPADHPPAGPTDASGPARAAGATAAAAVPAAGGKGLRQALRRRRHWVIAGVVVAASLLVLLLCGGLVAVGSFIDRDRDEHRDDRRMAASRTTACLELERRLNRLAPPGAAPDAARRATAIRDENAALRPYLTDAGGAGQHRDRDPRAGVDLDALTWWQQLLDARSLYADALDRQTAARTPAFFQPPRTPQAVAVTDRLVDTAPAACAGSIRRLAAPDL